jgi:aspartate/methionine/tyrosine aminotransferase
LNALAFNVGYHVEHHDLMRVAWLRLPAGCAAAEEVAAHLLARQKLALVPGTPRWFGERAAGHLRLCFATSEALLAEGLRRLVAGLNEA